MSDATSELGGRVSEGCEKISVPVAGSTKLYKGTMAAVNATGYAEDAADTANFKFGGVVVDTVDNSNGGDGDVYVELWVKGVFTFSSSADGADVGALVYPTDNQTVSTTAATNINAAGRIVEAPSSGKVNVNIQPEG